MTPRLWPAALLLTLLVAAAAHAEHLPPCTPDPSAPSDSLSPPARPTNVEAGFYVTELRDIDEVTDSFRFRGAVRIHWCDPRLAFDPEKAGTRERIWVGDAASVKLANIWYPRGFPVNRAGDFEVSERILRIRHDGAVRQDLNTNVALSADYDLRRFPFDEQILEVQIESSSADRDQLRFVPDAKRTGFSHDFEIPEWRILDVRGRVKDVEVARSDTPFQRYVLEIHIERRSGFYLWKVLLPLVVIIMLSWTVFWMQDETFAGRIRIVATGVLTVVAYQFVASEQLPRVAYLTLLDKIMVVSFALLAVTALESLLVSRMPMGSAEAHAVDRRSRWIFPLTYALLLGIVTLTSG
jgi:hypothetical protein